MLLVTSGVFMAKCLKIITPGKIDYIEIVQRMGENKKGVVK